MPVKIFVLKTLAVPFELVTILGLAPFMLNEVALVPVMVVFPIVNVPVAAPIPIVVAAPAKLTVVAVLFKILNVVAVVVKSPPFTSTSNENVTGPAIV